jgi:hypothetical protein
MEESILPLPAGTCIILVVHYLIASIYRVKQAYETSFLRALR